MPEDRPVVARSEARGAMWAVASAAAFSLSSVVGKDLLGALGVSSLLFWRFVVSSTVLWVALAIWRQRGGPDPLAVPRLRMLGLGVLMGIVVILGFQALDRLDASVYIVLVYMYPAIVVLVSAALGGSISRPMVIALAIITIGIVLTVPELFGGVGTISVSGVLLALGQAVAFAACMILNERHVPAHVDGVVTAAWINAGALAVIAPYAFADGVVTPHGGRLLTEVALFGLIPTVLATTCMFRALRQLAPGLVAMIMTLEVALAIAWSILFLGEQARLVKLLGAAVVVAGVLLAQRSRTPTNPAITAELEAATAVAP